MSAFNAYYYNEQIKKYIVQFMAIFAGMQVRVGASDGKEPRLIPVPIAYGSKDRVVADIKAQNVQTKLIRLPTFSTFLTNIELAPDLQKGIGALKRQTALPTGGLFPDDIRTIHQRMPVPYRGYFELMIFSSNTDQQMQIIEQLLSLFDPILQIQTSDEMFDWTKITTVKMEGIRLEENYPAGPGRRFVQTAMDFSIPMYISIPTDVREDYIKDIYVRLGVVDDTNVSSQEIIDELNSQEIEYDLIISLDDVDVEQPPEEQLLVRPPTDECRPPSPPVASPIIPPLPSGEFDLISDPAIDPAFLPNGSEFNDDGTKLYVAGFKTPGTDTGYIIEYDLSDPYNVLTCVYSGNQVVLSGTNERWARGLTFKPDGTRMFIATNGPPGSQSRVLIYNLSVPWDISSAVDTGDILNLTSDFPTGFGRQAIVHDIKLRTTNGTRMFVCGHTDDGIDEYDLSIPWTVAPLGSPAIITWNLFSNITNTDLDQVNGIFFKNDGSKLFATAADTVPEIVAQYPLSSPWDMSTVSATTGTYNVSSQTNVPTGVTITPDGLTMHVVSQAPKSVFQYPLSVPWDITSASFT